MREREGGRERVRERGNEREREEGRGRETLCLLYTFQCPVPD